MRAWAQCSKPSVYIHQYWHHASDAWGMESSCWAPLRNRKCLFQGFGLNLPLSTTLAIVNFLSAVCTVSTVYLLELFLSWFCLPWFVWVIIIHSFQSHDWLEDLEGKKSIELLHKRVHFSSISQPQIFRSPLKRIKQRYFWTKCKFWP